MTTPRIEEKLDIAIKNFVFSGLSIEKMDKIPKWLLENMEKNKPFLQKALTEAHQAGIDEAVERIVAIDIPKDGTDFEIAQLRYREKVIKALQDNK